jgi:putative endonuclease
VTDARQALGRSGEEVAARWLASRGWRILERRFRSGHRDLDLVVEREGEVAFIEVKTRRGAQFQDPVAAVNWRKQRELVRSAHVWLERRGRVGARCRFDVVGVVVTAAGVRVRHVENAFTLPWRA